MVHRYWFRISPENDVAQAIVNDTQNRECVTSYPDSTKKIVVQLDGYFGPDSLLSFGRERTACSVVCNAPEFPEAIARTFSRRHCQFFLDNNTLILRDDSSHGTTTISPQWMDSNPWRFPCQSSGTPRQRALLETGQWNLSVGAAEFVLEFPLKDMWWNRFSKEKGVVASRKLPIHCMLTLPTMSLPPALHETRIQTPQVPEDKIRDAVTYYELEHLGAGSFGRVSRVIDLQWGGIMAVKIINVERGKEKRAKEAIKLEVELLASLSHPHMVEFKHSQGWELGKPVEIFMSAADGSLRDLLDKKMCQHEKMANGDVARASQHIISGLHYLHGKNIINRDIKPENILFKGPFNNRIYSLADFGLSKQIDTKTSWSGSPLYWAPEICSRAPHDFRSDIWSLGVVVYEMLTGLALDRPPDLTRAACDSGEWCRRLHHACRGGGDLARMVNLEVEERMTSRMCYESSTFPVLPDELPPPFA